MTTRGDDTPNAHQDRLTTREAILVPSTHLKTSIAGHLDFPTSKHRPQLEETTITGAAATCPTTNNSHTDRGFAHYHAGNCGRQAE